MRLMIGSWLVLGTAALAMLLAPPALQAQGTLFVDGDNVGIGVETPAAALHVQRSNNTARVFVQETGAGNLEMFSLRNNGAPIFNFRDTSQADVRWEFAVAGTAGVSERFQINKVGSGQIEMLVFHDGNVTIAGSLTEGSSRSVKHDIVPLEGAAVLAKLRQLEISEWRFDRSPGARHVGPMAEDWHELFGLGDSDKRVAPRDLAGVALVAAKGLAERTLTLEAENAELRSRLERLEEILLADE